MTQHRIRSCISFLKMAKDMCYMDCCSVSMTIFLTDAQKKPDLLDQKEPLQ